MTLTLSPETEKILREAAVRQGRTPDELAEQAVKEKYALPQETPEEGRPEPTLAELFAGRTGLVDSEGKYNYSSHTGKAYTESLLKQREQATKTKES